MKRKLTKKKLINKIVKDVNKGASKHAKFFGLDLSIAEIAGDIQNIEKNRFILQHKSIQEMNNVQNKLNKITKIIHSLPKYLISKV